MKELLANHWRTVTLLILAQIVGSTLTAKPTIHAGYQAAYVDPGTGLFALQILGSSIMGGYYLLRVTLRSLFRRSALKSSNL